MNTENEPSDSGFSDTVGLDLRYQQQSLALESSLFHSPLKLLGIREKNYALRATLDHGTEYLSPKTIAEVKAGYLEFVGLGAYASHEQFEPESEQKRRRVGSRATLRNAGRRPTARMIVFL